MEVLQTRLVSDLSSNCYTVLMNEVLKSSWMVECNTHHLRNSDPDEKFAGNVSENRADSSAIGIRKVSEIATNGSAIIAGKAAENAANSSVIVIEIDDDSGPEDERTPLRSPPPRSQVYPSREDGMETPGEHEQSKLFAEGSSQTRGMELFEKGTSCVSGAISDGSKGMGLRQRPAAIIQSPDWLPQGWVAEIRVRSWGNTAGTKDKYYVDPSNGRRFRSRKEVMEYLQTGHLSRWKRKAKPGEPDGHGQPVADFVAQVECPAASLQKGSVPFYASSSLLAANTHVEASTVSYDGNNFEKTYTARLAVPSDKEIRVLNNAPNQSGHIPQFPMDTNFVSRTTLCPPPGEIIDLEAIPDTTFSSEARPFSNPPKVLSAHYTGSEEQASKILNSQVHSYSKDQICWEKVSHSGLSGILEGHASKTVEGCQTSNVPVSNGANSCQGAPLKGSRTYTPILNNVHFPSDLVRGSNGYSNDTQMGPFPGFGSAPVGNKPLLWHYQMLLPSFAGSKVVGQIDGQSQPPANQTDGIITIGTELQQGQAHSAVLRAEKDNATKIVPSGQFEKGPTFPIKIGKLHKLKRHEEKERLEMLGKKLCRESIAFMRANSGIHSYESHEGLG